MSNRRKVKEKTMSYAKMTRVEGERVTVQLASKCTPGTTIMRALVMATFSARKRTMSGSVT
jgi:hypothetical protein